MNNLKRGDLVYIWDKGTKNGYSKYSDVVRVKSSGPNSLGGETLVYCYCKIRDESFGIYKKRIHRLPNTSMTKLILGDTND